MLEQERSRVKDTCWSADAFMLPPDVISCFIYNTHSCKVAIVRSPTGPLGSTKFSKLISIINHSATSVFSYLLDTTVCFALTHSYMVSSSCM